MPTIVPATAASVSSKPTKYRKKSATSNSSSNSPGLRLEEKLSSWQVGAHLVSFMAGSGLLYLPLALVEIEWYGLVLLFTAASVSSYTSKVFIEVLDVVRWSHGSPVYYGDLAYEAFGRIGQYTTNLFVHGSFLISCTGYLGLAASCFSSVTGLHTTTALWILGICVWFHVLVKSLKALAIFSAINVALSFWIEAVIFGDAMYPLKQIELQNSAFVLVTPDLSNAPMYTKSAYSFALLISGFAVHAVVPTFYNVMEQPRQCVKVVSSSQWGVMATLYLPICIITYGVYGASMQAPVFFNMRNDFVRSLAIMLYCIHLLLSYTIAVYPMQQAFENFLLRMPCGDLLPIEKTRSSNSSSTSSNIEVEFMIRLVCRTVLILLTLCLAYVFKPSTLDIFCFMLVPATFVSLLLPSILYLKLCDEEAGCLDKIANYLVLILAVGSIVLTLGILI
jgi:vesicular inhibitory amino acid transporter